MKIYTKTGDAGETGLFAGPRVSKDDARIEAYGTVDELNATLGFARTQSPPAEIDQLLAQFQNELFAVGAELATPEPERHSTNFIGDQNIAALEAIIDDWEARLPPLRQFILPGGTAAASALHLARAVCRRAERRLVTLVRNSPQPVAERLIHYLNRLGDLLFVLSRAANALAGQTDIPWKKPDPAT